MGDFGREAACTIASLLSSPSKCCTFNVIPIYYYLYPPHKKATFSSSFFTVDKKMPEFINLEILVELVVKIVENRY